MRLDKQDVRVWYQVWGQVSDQVWGQVSDQVWGQVGHRTRGKP
jgi:hypothetical protein